MSAGATAGGVPSGAPSGPDPRDRTTDVPPGHATTDAPAGDAATDRPPEGGTAPPGEPSPGGGTRPVRQRLREPRLRDAWVLAGVSGLLYSLVAVLQWRRFESPSWDLGIFTQLAKAYGNLEAPIVPIKGEGFNLLGDHFHPVLVLLGPVYRVFPSGLTLLVVQALLVAVSVFPLTRVAIDRLGRWPGVAAGAAYAFSFGIQGAVGAQFHEIAFALPLLGFALEAFLRGRFVASAAWAAPLVLVKEDLGLTVLVLGLVIAWRGATRVGLALAAWGAAWFILATVVILPALNPRGQWDYTDRLTLGDAVGDPLGTLAGVLSPGEKIVTLLMLAAVAGVVGVRSPLVLAMVPTLAWRFLGNVPFYWGWTWHYNAVLMPLACAALLDVLGPRPDGDDPAPAAGHRARVRLTVGISLAVSLLATPDLALGRLVDADSYRPSARHEGARGALDAVPDGATVSSDIALIAYLVPTTTVYWSGNPENPVPDYVVIDRLNGTWAGNPPADAAAYAEGKHRGTDFELVYSESDYQVARLVAAP